MKSKTLVKSKIVLSDNGRGLTTYFWKKTFWIFGYWYPFGVSGGDKIESDRIEKINDDNVSKVLFDNFIKNK